MPSFDKARISQDTKTCTTVTMTTEAEECHIWLPQDWLSVSCWRSNCCSFFCTALTLHAATRTDPRLLTARLHAGCRHTDRIGSESLARRKGRPIRVCLCPKAWVTSSEVKLRVSRWGILVSHSRFDLTRRGIPVCICPTAWVTQSEVTLRVSVSHSRFDLTRHGIPVFIFPTVWVTSSKVKLRMFLRAI
jgi:hypothetical protein